MVALGLLLLAAAGVTAVVGVLANTGANHAIGGDFSVYGYHVATSTGRLFLYGIVVGAVGVLGLYLLLNGLRRMARHRLDRRRELKATRDRNETTTDERDRLARELEAERTRSTVDVRHSDAGPVDEGRAEHGDDVASSSDESLLQRLRHR